MVFITGFYSIAVDSHIDHCEEEHCIHCDIIFNAQIIMTAVFAICAFIAIIYCVKIIVSKIQFFYNFLSFISLVKLSVQLNN